MEEATNDCKFDDSEIDTLRKARDVLSFICNIIDDDETDFETLRDALSNLESMRDEIAI